MVQASAKIFSGPEPSLLAEAVRACFEELVGTQDRSLVLEELSGEEYAIEQVVDAVQTPPLLSDRRVVVVREFTRFKVDQLKPLIELLSALPSTSA